MITEAACNEHRIAQKLESCVTRLLHKFERWKSLLNTFVSITLGILDVSPP